MSELLLYVPKRVRLKAPNKGVEPTVFVRLSVADAHKMIESLAAQLVAGNPNSGRHEFAAIQTNTSEPFYFSVSVHKEFKP